MRWLHAIRRAYTATAVMALNIFLLFVFANLSLGILYRVRDHRARRGPEAYVFSHVRPASWHETYPGWDRAQIHRLLMETWSRPYVYEPFTQFREAAFRGEYVNVSENGYRYSVPQGPWPPDSSAYNVFLFGGSTAFGYGLPDDETIATYLQGALSIRLRRQVHVYNFARGSYVSTQERILFEMLLEDGFVPDMAVFVDGLNEFAIPGAPAYTQRLRDLFDSRGRVAAARRFMDRLPMARLAATIRGRILEQERKKPSAPGRTVVAPASYNDSTLIDRVIRRYRLNKRLIEATSLPNACAPVFVWQPIPLYKYDLTCHVFADEGFGSNWRAHYGYCRMERMVGCMEEPRDFLWCADMQDSLQVPLYVDRVHYTAAMCQRIAEKVANMVVQRRLMDTPEIAHQ